MKRIIYLCFFITLFLTACSESEINEAHTTQMYNSTKAPQVSQIENNYFEEYKTLITPDNRLGIVRTPPAPDYTKVHPGKLTQLPTPDAQSLTKGIDIRSADLSGLDLRNKRKELLNSDFDSVTKWPLVLPSRFSPQDTMQLGKNPGLGVRNLHRKGITGKNVGLAIIDESLLVEHIEYRDRLKMYEEIHNRDVTATMHGPAVASIAVGKTVGVAPEADLYFIANTAGYWQNGNFEYDLMWLAQSIDRIIQVNRTLTKENKIRVISISLTLDTSKKGYDKVKESIEKAKKEGIYTVYCNSDPLYCLGRNPMRDPDDFNSFVKGGFWADSTEAIVNKLFVPMDSRCTASPTGSDDYVFYRYGGMSWSVPYVAGLYALACQVYPDITPEIFWNEAFKTGSIFEVDNNGNKVALGKIVNPVKLIDNIQNLK